MSQTSKTVQNEMWNRLRKTHCPVTIYLCNGVRLSRVVVVSFDMFAVTVRTDSEMQLVCKSNIATVVPETRKRPPASPFKRTAAPRPETPANKPVVIVKRSHTKLASVD